ncbi:MAG: hypothetical protein ACLTSX_14280 [Collinsella sp.]
MPSASRAAPSAGFYTLGLVTLLPGALARSRGTFSDVPACCASIPLVMRRLVMVADRRRARIAARCGGSAACGCLPAVRRTACSSRSIAVWFSSRTQAIFLAPFRYM